MKEQSFPQNNMAGLAKTFSEAIEMAGSLDDIETWFRSQKFIKSAVLNEYLLKSNPPQRELRIEIESPDGTAIVKIVNFFDLGDQVYRLHEVRDP